MSSLTPALIECQIPTDRQNASITVVGTMLNRETDSAPAPLPDPPMAPLLIPLAPEGMPHRPPDTIANGANANEPYFYTYETKLVDVMITRVHI